MKSWCASVDDEGRPATVALGNGGGKPRRGGFVWCHLHGRDAEERRWLESDSGLPHAVIASLTAVETRPRCDQIGAGALINLRGLGSAPAADADPLVSIRLWAEQGRVISVGFRSMAAVEPIRAEMATGRIRDPGDLIAALAVAITAELDPKIAGLGDEIDACEADLDPDRAFAMRRMIARVRSEAIGYRRFVVPQRQALERLSLLDAAWIEEEDRLHLREAADRFARMAEELEAVRERSALMHEQLTDLRAEQIETRTLLLSIVALVFLPLTFLTGLLGMNVAGIPYADEPWAFWGVFGLCVAVAVGIGSWFVRAHWFHR